MPTSAPGSSERGLTLVEVLVVVGVMALMTAVVVTTVPPATSEAEAAARDLSREVTALADEAVTRGRTLGLSAEDGLEVLTYTDEWRTDRTLPLTRDLRVAVEAADELLPPDEMPTGTLVIYRPPGDEAEEAPPPPPVLFGPTGEVTPFVLRVEDRREAWTVTVGPFAEAEVARER